MTQYKSDLLNLLSERGYIHQITDASAIERVIGDKPFGPGEDPHKGVE